MELTGKQRAQLRGMANGLDTILHVGKDGIGENLLRQADSALEARELIKGRVLENSMLSSRQAAQAVAEATGAAVVQVIGTRFVLYRPSRKKDRADRIILVQSKEK
ncbi:MAG: YhbY family RNA-binding protein [Oscillospiraceae bacterium]|nr:YhbY family RNA-binding protein [Oscillospiraceae bacterium]